MTASTAARPPRSSAGTVLCITAVVAFAVLFAGAIRTSAQIWAGISPEHGALSQSVLLAKGHEHAGNLLMVLLLVCLWITWRSGKRLVLWLTAIATVAAICELLTGFFGPMQLTTLRTYTHALSGHITFSCIAAAAVIAVTRVKGEASVSIPSGFPVRAVADWIPVLVVSQVAMGAAYRHNFWSIMPHMAGAILVAFILVAEGVTILQRAPEHRLLSLAAKWAIGIVIAQIALGIADFILRLLDFENSSAWFFVSISHVAVGSITFATSICLAVVVRAFVTD
jgi:hypothetical protein